MLLNDITGIGEIKAPDETGRTLVGGQSQDASCEFFICI